MAEVPPDRLGTPESQFMANKKLDIVCIAPELAGIYSASDIFMPPMGLLYIATVLRCDGHHVHLCDVSVDGPPDDLIDGSDLVMITATTSQYNDGLRYAREAHEKGKPVVMGGAHASFTYEEILATGAVDYVVIAEGEATAVELAGAIREHGRNFDPSRIRGIAWRDDGAVRKSEPRPFIEDIDTIPIPDRSLLNIEAYKRTKLEKRHSATTMITSRGCPYDCSFCVATKLTGKRWRKHSVDRVIREMKEIVDVYGFEGVFFSDDNFSVDMERIRQLCTAIIREKLQVRWWCMSRSDTVVRNEKDIALMAESGCGTVFLGIESPDDKVLAAYHKKSTADTSRRAVEILQANGIRVQGSFILGGPTETVRDIRRTVAYACGLNPKIGQFSLLTPYPGTRICRELGDRVDLGDWDRFDGTHAVYESDFATRAEREKEYKRAFTRFYFRPRYILNHWRTINYVKTFSLLRSLKSGRADGDD